MCGIVGYVGSREALPVLISGLEKLEYRGYDSAGVAVISDEGVQIKKAPGKLSELKKVLSSNGTIHSHLGIGHTRWATHGKPSEVNSHPHSAGRVTLIHNGIVENYMELRAELAKEGSVFKSETDTEIVAHLFNKLLSSGLKPFNALKKVCELIRGSYAFVAIDEKSPDRLLVAKNATPIVLGLGENENFVASDIPALLEYTRKVIALEDGDLAEITSKGVYIENQGKQVQRDVLNITWDPVTAQKGGYKHYMLKEIHDQPEVLAEVFRGRVVVSEPAVSLPELQLSAEQIKKIKRIVFVACGSAWHAALVAKFYFESLSGIPCDVDYASEFRYRTPLLNQDVLLMAISQSGETLDTLGAIEIGKGRAPTFAICNVLGSSITRKVDNVLLTQAGPEISVASTKAFTTQLVAAYLLALHFGACRGVLSSAQIGGLTQNLFHLPSACDALLKLDEQIQQLAKKFYTARDFLFLGRGILYPIALEGSLKLKEISYIHAEGYPAGEMKHGPIALIDENMPVVMLIQRSPTLVEKAISNLREVQARDGRVIVVTDCDDIQELSQICQNVIQIPHISEELSPVLFTVPLQLLAYYVAVLNGTDVDLPRNLAKSVTVE